MKKMKETNNMQVGKWLVIIMAAVALIGCSDTSVDAQYAQRQQMLDAQQVSIDSVEREIMRIRDSNSADMSKWSPCTNKAVSIYANRVSGTLCRTRTND